MPFPVRKRSKVQPSRCLPPLPLVNLNQIQGNFSVPTLLLSKGCLPKCNLLLTGLSEGQWGGKVWSIWTLTGSALIPAPPCPGSSTTQRYTTLTPLTGTGMLRLFSHDLRDRAQHARPRALWVSPTDF